MKILDLGCGRKKFRGEKKDKIIGMDKARLEGVDVVHDAEKYPYPFKSNTFDMIYADNVLEHLSDLIKTMEELHRISKPGAQIIIRVPYWLSPSAFHDPTHKRFFTENTFNYFTEDNLPFSNLNYYSKARFKIISKTSIVGNPTRRAITKLIKLLRLDQLVYFKMYDGLEFILEVVK